MPKFVINLKVLNASSFHYKYDLIVLAVSFAKAWHFLNLIFTYIKGG